VLYSRFGFVEKVEGPSKKKFWQILKGYFTSGKMNVYHLFSVHVNTTFKFTNQIELI